MDERERMQKRVRFFFQHAHALELLRDQLQPGKKALDVGSGSGYLTACFAIMVNSDKGLNLEDLMCNFLIHLQLGPSGRVVGIDHVKELVAMSEANVRKNHADLLDSGRIKLVGKRVRLSIDTQEI